MTTYSILIPTNREREGLLRPVIENIHQVFSAVDYEICLGDVSGKDPLSLPSGKGDIRYLTVDKPPNQAIYVPYPELIRASLGQFLVVWCDDLLFCRGFATRANHQIAQGKWMVQAACVDPELYVVLTEYKAAYGPSVISRDLVLAHLDELGTGKTGGVPFFEGCLADAKDHDRYIFLQDAFFLHMGYPVGPGQNSTLFPYKDLRRFFDVWEWLRQCRAEHAFVRVSAEEFPFYDEILDAQVEIDRSSEPPLASASPTQDGSSGAADARRVRLELGIAALAQGQAVRAWEYFGEILAENPGDAEAMHCLLRAGTALQLWEPLAAQLAEYLKVNPADLAIRFVLACVCVNLENWAAAQCEYETLRSLAPTFEGLDDLAQALDQKALV